MDFQKVQLRASLKTPINSTITMISIEVSYPNSNGEYTWKSSGRLYNKNSMSYLKKTSKIGTVIDAIVPSMWNDLDTDSKQFVFDFVKNETSSNLKIKQLVVFNTNETAEVQFEIKDSAKIYESDYLSFIIVEKNIGTE